MEDNKAEEIKEVLKNTMDLDTIEDQLKEKTSKIGSTPKKELKEEKSPLNEPYPNIKLETAQEKKKRNKNLNIIIIILILICILLFTLLYFQFNNETETNKSIETKKQSTQIIDSKKEIIKKVLVEKQEKKEEKVVEVKKAQVEKNQDKKILEKVVEDKKEIEEKTLEVKKEAPKTIEKNIKNEKYNIISKEKTFKDYYNSTKYQKLTCYDFKEGTTRPSKECKSQLKKFLLKNKDMIRLEVIAVIGESDIKLFDKLDSIKVNNLKSSKLKDFMLRGLGRERVLETTWFIRETLGEDVVLTPTNYYVKSLKDNKGFLIKAYH